MRTLKRAGVEHLFNECSLDSNPEFSPDVLIRVEYLVEALKTGTAPKLITDTDWHSI